MHIFLKFFFNDMEEEAHREDALTTIGTLPKRRRS